MQISEPLWTASECELILGAKSTVNWYASGVHTDSRTVVPGDIFVALRGAKMNGHDYVMDAFKRGAVAAVVDSVPEQISMSDHRLLYVENTEKALKKLAVSSRKRMPGQVVAVTGSVGKTSVVQALRSALERSGPAHSSIKSFNNHIGVPLSMARMSKNCRFGVFELGMSGAGEIAPISEIVSPDVAIVTAIGAAHLQAFDSLEAIAEEKASVFKSVKAGGSAVIGMDHDHADLLCQRAKEAGLTVIRVGFDDSCDIYPLKISSHADCSCITLRLDDQLMTIKINQPGREWVLNGMLVMAAVMAVGGDLAQAGLSLAGLQAERGRGRLYVLPFERGDLTLQDDSYNANPLSMRAALKRFAQVPKQPQQKQIAVLADMAELGADSLEKHLELEGDIRAAGFHEILTVGPEMQAAAQATGVPVVSFDHVGEVIEYLDKSLTGMERLFVKGSNGAGLMQLVDHLVILSRQQSRYQAVSKRQQAELAGA